MSRLWSFTRRYGFDLLIAIAAIAGALEVALRHDPLQAPSTTPWFAVPATAVMVSTLLARRRFPFAAPAAFWLIAAALSVVDGRLVVFSVSVYAAGMAASFLLGNLADGVQRRIGLAVALLGLVVVIYNDPNHIAGDFIFNPILVAGAWLAGFALHERGMRAEAAEDRARHAELERAEAARRAVFEERVRIARELHDVVAHHVSMMGVQAGAARFIIDRDRPKAKESLAAIEASSRQAVAELHRLLGFLRQAGDSDDLATPGLRQLPGLTAGMSHAELAIVLDIEGEERPLPPTVDLSAYRIVQEALTNTVKHAEATRADVHLRYGPGELELEIVDDGRGPAGPSERPGGLGLIGMRERAALHGGQLTVGPAPGGGFAVRVRLPTPDGSL